MLEKSWAAEPCRNFQNNDTKILADVVTCRAERATADVIGLGGSVNNHVDSLLTGEKRLQLFYNAMINMAMYSYRRAKEKTQVKADIQQATPPPPFPKNAS